MKETDMYETICRERFDELKNGQNEVIALLRGRNGDPGLLDDMRAIKRAYRAILAAVIFIVGILVTQGVESFVHWLRPK